MVNLFQNGKTGKRLTAEGGQEAQSTQREPSFVSGALSARTCGFERLHVARISSRSHGLVRGDVAEGARHGRRPLRLQVLKWVARRDGKSRKDARTSPCATGASRKTGTGVPCPYNLVWTRLGGGALGVERHYLLGYLFYVGDAE